MHPLQPFRRQTWWPAVLFILGLVMLGSPAPLSAEETPAPRGQQTSPPFDPAQVPTPVSPPIAQFGRELYAQNCAPCHGPEGRGDGPAAADLSVPPAVFADPDVIEERSPAELFYTAKFGRIENLMPPWQSRMDDDQIWSTIAYVWSLHTTQAEVIDGAQLYRATCASCHGEGGAGDGPDAPPTLPDFTDLAYTIARSQADWRAGWQAAHPEIGADLSPQEQRGVLEYIRSFSYTPPWDSTYRPGDGVIAGRVVQGTAGGPDVGGLDVTLQAFLQFSPVAVFTATTGTEGEFQFTDLATDPGIVYLASVTSQGVNYSSPVLQFGDSGAEIDTVIDVYAPTDDPKGIRVDRLHWIIDFRPGALIVGQIFAFGSRSDRAFVGAPVEGMDEPVTAVLSVPEGAEEIGFENGALGGRFRRQGNRIYDTAPILPGEATRQIIMRYTLPYPGTEADLKQEFLYPIRSLNLLVADLPNLEVRVPGLTSVGPQDIQGTVYRLWQGEALEPQTVAVSLSGLLEAGAVDPRTLASQSDAPSELATVPTLEPWAPWTIGALVLVGVLGVLGWSWRSRILEEDNDPAPLRRQRDELVRRIAHLDDLHAVGELNERSWQKQRARLKAKLLTLASQLDEVPGG